MIPSSFYDSNCKECAMLENEIAVNESLIGQFNNTVNDILEDELFHPCAGHGHPPVWILGHLAIVAELGQKMLGGSVVHQEWMPLFGIGSSDIIAPDDSLTKHNLTSAVVDGYDQLRLLASKADANSVSRGHQIGFFEGTPIKTVGHCITLILTSHFGFHLGQLSSCRRSAGFGPLF